MMWWMAVAAAVTLEWETPQLDGELSGVLVSDVAPGANVIVVAGARATSGPCPPFPGDCLDIDGRLRTVLGIVQADSQGRVARRFTNRLAPGDWFVQALAFDTRMESSAVLPLRVYERLSDDDGDRASNILEWYARTPLDDPDADDDGVLDAVDLWPYAPGVPSVHAADDAVVSDPTDSLPDPEFDGVGHQLVWQTRTGSEVWVADIDPQTGFISPLDGRGELVDTDVLPLAAVRNGPEWVQTDQGAMALYAKDRGSGSEIVVARDQAGWVPTYLGPGLGGIGSLDPGDPNPRIYYAQSGNPPLARTRYLFDAASDLNFGVPLWWGRWISGGDGLIAYADDADGVPQVVVADPITGDIEQRTFSPTFKRSVFGWQAPEHGVEAFFTTVGPPRSQVSVAMEVYLSDGAGGWVLHDTITGPPGHPFIVSPEPFVVGGQSYIAFLASKMPLNEHDGRSEVWVVDIDPDTQWARRVSDGSVAVIKDPEPIVFGDQAFVYYSEAVGQRRVLHRCDVGL